MTNIIWVAKLSSGPPVSYKTEDGWGITYFQPIMFWLVCNSSRRKPKNPSVLLSLLKEVLQIGEGIAVEHKIKYIQACYVYQVFQTNGHSIEISRQSL